MSRIARKSSAAGDLVALVVCVGLCLGAGYGSSLLGGAEPGPWYESLRKPAFTPPSALFAPVWTLLYALMGVALWRVWLRRDAENRRIAIMLFVSQLLLNVLWTAIFFGLQDLRFALFEIGLLWFAIALTIQAFFRISMTAGFLLVPYWLWVSFAAVLNFAFWYLNRG